MFAGRLFAVRLLLADQRVQFAEMFFFLPFFCLEEEVHFSYDISSDRLTDVFFLILHCWTRRPLSIHLRSENGPVPVE